MKLPNRLRAVAQFIPTGSRLADIGTDHARLPVWLVQAGHCSSAIAADLRPGPLESARRTIREAGLEEKIETRLSDGVDAIAPQEADAVAMAGMGGETIAGILHRGWKDWTGKTLVLQPMSKQAELCAWLADHGFAIEDEALAADGDMLYRILLVRPGVWRVENPAWLYAGLPLLTRRDPLLPV